MRIQDLHELPKIRDSLSYLYLERGRIEQTQKSIEFFDKYGRTLVPAASLSVLMLGPGTSISHEAVKTLTDNGCLINWCGEQGVRFYAQGGGETRKGYQLMRQAALVSDPVKRMMVVRRMYQYRFDEDLDATLTIEQVRGMEGARVRRAYSEASRHFGVPWRARAYVRQHWGASDTINRALSAANACLNGLCHAAIVSAGYSPGLGFIHQGKQLSFVYDIADLYKSKLTVPLAFRLVSESRTKVETRVRHACRNLFHAERLLPRIMEDIEKMLNLTRPLNDERVDLEIDFDADPAQPAALWSPTDADGSQSPGGVNYADLPFTPWPDNAAAAAQADAQGES
ncbi:MAG: type I-E CRISPR-associated endonuclease Cas1e [Caldilineaceae bacterium]